MSTNEYVVQPTTKKDTYSIHKFVNDEDIPEITYTVYRDHNAKLKCNCPSGEHRGYCKHTTMVAEYRRQERKDPNAVLTSSFEG
jgi:hypothetical protein